MSKQLAVMSEPHFGMRDMSHPAFWFSVSFGADLSSGALIILSTEKMTQAVIDADVHDIKDLKGKPCQVEVNESNIVNFVKILKN